MILFITRIKETSKFASDIDGNATPHSQETRRRHEDTGMGGGVDVRRGQRRHEDLEGVDCGGPETVAEQCQLQGSRTSIKGSMP